MTRFQGLQLRFGQLPLAHRFSRNEHNAEDLAERLAVVLAGSVGQRPSAPEGFVHRSAAVNLGGLRLFAAVHGSLALQCTSGPGSTLVLLPLSGAAIGRVDGIEHLPKPELGGLLLSAKRFGLQTADYEGLILAVPTDRLRQAVATLTDAAAIHALDEQLGLPLALPQVAGALQLLPRLLAWACLQDGSCAGQVLQAEDLVIRSVALSLASLCQRPVRVREARRTQVLARTCSHLMDGIAEGPSMTTLAQACNVSPRTLQLHFMQHFGMSPFDWLQEQRLQLAFRLLQASDAEGTRVTDVAQRCGIAHLGRFAGDFRRRFGTTPSRMLTLQS